MDEELIGLTVLMAAVDEQAVGLGPLQCGQLLARKPSAVDMCEQFEVEVAGHAVECRQGDGEVGILLFHLSYLPADIDLPVHLLANLPEEGLFTALTRFHLATRKLPMLRHIVRALSESLHTKVIVAPAHHGTDHVIMLLFHIP